MTAAASVPARAWPLVCGALWSGVIMALAWRSRPPARLGSLVRSASDRVSRRSEASTGGRRRMGTIESVRSAVAAGFERFGRGLRRCVGRPVDPARDRRLGMAAGAALAAAVVIPWTAVLVGPAVWIAPWMAARRATRRQRDRVGDELPDVVDLLRLALGAGYSLRLAIATVAERSAGLTGDRLARAKHRLERGSSLADALVELEALGEPVAPLVDALRSADRYGAPLLPMLARVSADARSARRRRAEERARRVPVKLLFPLVFCTLPAFGLLTVVPVLASALAHLSL
jgi:tight adherence protein C